MGNKMRLSMLVIALAVTIGTASLLIGLNRGSADATVLPPPPPVEWGETRGVWCGEGCDGYGFSSDFEIINGPGEQLPPIPVYDRKTDQLIGHMYPHAGFTALGEEPVYRGVGNIVGYGDGIITHRQIIEGRETDPVTYYYSSCEEFAEIQEKIDTVLDPPPECAR